MVRAPGILAAVALAWAGSFSAVAPPALLPTIERFDSLTVGDAVSVSDLHLTGPHVDCVLQSGRAAPVRAGGEVAGVFFEGKGAVDYLSADPIEAPVVVFNAKKGSSLKPEKTAEGVRLRDRFKRLLWLARGSPLPALSGAPAAPLADDFRKQREKFGRMHAPPLSHDFALQLLDAPDAPLIWAEIDGGREDLLYVFDGTDDPSEGLATLNRSESRESELRKFLWLAPLSLQPIGRDPRDPPPPRFLLTDVDLTLAASAGNDAKLSVVETLVPLGRPARALRFDVDTTVYAQAGANLEARDERVRSVTDEKGRSLAFDHRLDELVVALAEPAPAGEPLKLRFEIDGDFLVRPRGDRYWELGIWSWFPQPPLSGQAYTFRATVRVKKPFVPFAPGVTVRRWEEGDENVLETRIDTPIQFAVILAGKYDMEEDVRDGVRIRVATYALDNPRGRKQLTNVAAEIIAYYKEFLGPFPFSEFNILEINDYGFGQAPPATMFITKEAFDPLVGDMSRFEAQEIAKIFAHEIAHQYWGIVVRIPGPQEQWLAESFSEYCASLFLKDRRSAAVQRALSKRWRRGANFAGDAAPIPLANRVWVSDDALRRAEIRNGLLYDKGPLLLAALHRELGDEAFLAFLRSFQASFAWKFGSTRDVERLLQSLSGKDTTPFFEKYYWGTEMPGD
jgi:Peptidase family M1 domain